MIPISAGTRRPLPANGACAAASNGWAGPTSAMTWRTRSCRSEGPDGRAKPAGLPQFAFSRQSSYMNPATSPSAEIDATKLILPFHASWLLLDTLSGGKHVSGKETLLPIGTVNFFNTDKANGFSSNVNGSGQR